MGDVGLIPGLGRSLEKGKVGLKSTFLFVVSGLFPQFLFLYFIFFPFLGSRHFKEIFVGPAGDRKLKEQ